MNQHVTHNPKGDKLYPHYGDYPTAKFIKAAPTGTDAAKAQVAWTDSQGCDPSTIIAPKPAGTDINAAMQGGEGNNDYKKYRDMYQPTQDDKDAVAVYHEWQQHKRG